MRHTPCRSARSNNSRARARTWKTPRLPVCVLNPLVIPSDCIYNKNINIEFDPAKNQRNIEKHGISLPEAQAFDFASALIAADSRFDYGEQRYNAIGWQKGRLHVLTFTLRGENLRAISLRKANKREVAKYENAIR